MADLNREVHPELIAALTRKSLPVTAGPLLSVRWVGGSGVRCRRAFFRKRRAGEGGHNKADTAAVVLIDFVAPAVLDDGQRAAAERLMCAICRCYSSSVKSQEEHHGRPT